MIGSRGFQILEAPRASSGSVRVRLPLLGESHSPLISEDCPWPRITLTQRERAPPELTRVTGKPRHSYRPGPRHGAGPAEGAAGPGNQSPPESTTERSQL
jgi:hypothetical protein